MARIAQSLIVALQRFAKGLADDYDAIKAGLMLSWSTSPVEGHMTRLKLLKRPMWGCVPPRCGSFHRSNNPRQGPPMTPS